jgi:hypothetical protein
MTAAAVGAGIRSALMLTDFPRIRSPLKAANGRQKDRPGALVSAIRLELVWVCAGFMCTVAQRWLLSIARDGMFRVNWR